MSAIPAVVFSLGFLLGQSSVGLAADFTGPVVSNLDRDTIEVLHNGQAELVRLYGIDCPEKGQAYGTRASKPRLNSCLGRKAHSKPSAMTSTGGRLPMGFCRTEPTSITN